MQRCKNYYKNIENNDYLLRKIINKNYENYENINFCRHSFKDKNFNTINKKDFRDFIEGSFTKIINSYNTENSNDKIRLIKSYNIFDKEKIFTDKQLELFNIFIKKKDDLDILFYEECCLENHVKILKSDIYRSYKIINFFENQNNDYWKNKNFKKYEICEIVEDHISSSLENNGFIKDKYTTEDLTDVKTCDLLKDYIECYNNTNKNNNKLKYIEKLIKKPYLIFGSNKICTILIDNDD